MGSVVRSVVHDRLHRLGGVHAGNLGVGMVVVANRLGVLRVSAIDEWWWGVGVGGFGISRSWSGGFV